MVLPPLTSTAAWNVKPAFFFPLFFSPPLLLQILWKLASFAICLVQLSYGPSPILPLLVPKIGIARQDFRQELQFRLAPSLRHPLFPFFLHYRM